MKLVQVRQQLYQKSVQIQLDSEHQLRNQINQNQRQLQIQKEIGQKEIAAQ